MLGCACSFNPLPSLPSDFQCWHNLEVLKLNCCELQVQQPSTRMFSTNKQAVVYSIHMHVACDVRVICHAAD